MREAENFPDPDQTFERRLGYVLDGLAALVPAGRPARAARERPSRTRSRSNRR